MEERSQGIILRIRPLTESSVIVHWLAPESGRLSTVAKGAKRPKSPFRGKLDLFFAAEFSFHRSRRSDLHTLREVMLIRQHAGLRIHLEALQLAAYAAALIEVTTETETPLPMPFQLMTELLVDLESKAVKPLTLFAFELRMLAELGLSPGPKASRLTPGTRSIVRHLVTAPEQRTPNLALSESQTGELDRFLRQFMAHHLERLPKNRPKVT